LHLAKSDLRWGLASGSTGNCSGSVEKAGFAHLFVKGKEYGKEVEKEREREEIPGNKLNAIFI